MQSKTEALARALFRRGIPAQRLLTGAPMRAFTSFRIGGPADLLLQTADGDEAAFAAAAAKEAGVPLTVVGNGSNLLVRDGGIRGLVLRISGEGAGIREEGVRGDGTDLAVPAGFSLTALAQQVCRMGLGGFAPLSGIPGTLGGGAVMNAGAYGGELSQLVTWVRGFHPADGRAFFWTGEEAGFGYRRSRMQDEGAVVTAVGLRLPPADPETVRQEMQTLAARRREKQPLDLPSAGSAFRRPPGAFAAKLIDEAGLRGLACGGAAVSEKHAGFIVNLGGATASDVLALMETVRARVFDRSGVLLEPEIRILGEDAPRGG